MNETRCKVGDEYYQLTFNKRSTNAGTQFYGTLFLDAAMNYQYLIDAEGEIKTFEPSNTNEHIIVSIKDAVDDVELNQASLFVE